jgi:hypothetical protein
MFSSWISVKLTLISKTNSVGLNGMVDPLMTHGLPWWKGEVEQCVVDGRVKSFNVYFIG